MFVRGLNNGKGKKKAYIIPGIPEIGLFLLPEKIDVQVLHQRRELIGDVLKRLGAPSQRVEQLVVGVEKLPRRQHGDGALCCPRQPGHIAAMVRGAEKKDRVGGDEDGVEMGDLLRGSAGGIDHCL